MVHRGYPNVSGFKNIKPIVFFSLVLFFLFFSDAILSFWVPVYVEEVFLSPLLMGIVLGSSSLVGFLADLAFPNLLRQFSVRKMVTSAFLLSFVFIFVLKISVLSPKVIFIFLAMAVWGIYYEFVGFAKHKYVAESVSYKLHSSAWAIIGVFTSLAYFLGPIIGGRLISSGRFVLLNYALILSFIGVVSFIVFYKSKHAKKEDNKQQKLNFFEEFKYWRTLSKSTWTVVILSILFGLVDATFWTIGAVWTQKLGAMHSLGVLFLSFYVLPSLFMGFIMAEIRIFKGKKKLSEKFFMLSSLFLILTAITTNVYFQLAMAFLTGVCLAVMFPLLSAVYSDLEARMDSEKRHLIGLINSSGSIAYIIGPVIAGFVASLVGEMKTFSVLGIFVLVATIVLYLMTPVKIRLPQKEINKWD